MKTLKFYEAPEVEVVDVEVEGQILAGSEGGILDPVEEEED
jgi:hypothetical protein